MKIVYVRLYMEDGARRMKDGAWRMEDEGCSLMVNGSVEYGGLVVLPISIFFIAQSHGGSKSIHSGWMKRVWHQKKRSFII